MKATLPVTLALDFSFMNLGFFLQSFPHFDDLFSPESTEKWSGKMLGTMLFC